MRRNLLSILIGMSIFAAVGLCPDFSAGTSFLADEQPEFSLVGWMSMDDPDEVILPKACTPGVSTGRFVIARVANCPSAAGPSFLPRVRGPPGLHLS